MERLSKFDCGCFYGENRWFAVSKQRFTKEEALEMFKRELDGADVYEIHDAAVQWRAGVNEDGERVVGWWLQLDCDGTEPRCCPVWAIEY